MEWSEESCSHQTASNMTELKQFWRKSIRFIWVHLNRGTNLNSLTLAVSKSSKHFLKKWMQWGQLWWTDVFSSFFFSFYPVYVFYIFLSVSAFPFTGENSEPYNVDADKKFKKKLCICHQHCSVRNYYTNRKAEEGIYSIILFNISKTDPGASIVSLQKNFELALL